LMRTFSSPYSFWLGIWDSCATFRLLAQPRRRPRIGDTSEAIRRSAASGVPRWQMPAVLIEI
jgi:hypothetical protein